MAPVLYSFSRRPRFWVCVRSCGASWHVDTFGSSRNIVLLSLQLPFSGSVTVAKNVLNSLL